MQKAVELAPEPDLASGLIILGNLSSSLYRKSNRLADIDISISAFQRSIELTPDDQPVKPQLLSSLVLSLLLRYDHSDVLIDLERGISAQRAAIELMPNGHPHKAAGLNNLGTAILRLFKRNGEMDDLGGAVTAFLHSVDLTPVESPEKSTRLSNLGNSLQERFERSGKLDDLENAILFKRLAVELAPDGHPSKPTWLSNLGNALSSRFRRYGERDDLENAISALRLATQLTPDAHHEKPAQLNNLGDALQCRFDYAGDPDDVQATISLLRVALDLTPSNHRERPKRLNNLGRAFHSRYRRLNDLADLDSAISLQRQVLEITSDKDADRPTRLNYLGVSLHDRSLRSGSVDDIESAITLQRSAIELTSNDDPYRASRLICLGQSLQSRFKRDKTQQGFDEALACFMGALTGRAGHPNQRLRSALYGVAMLHENAQFSSWESSSLAYSRIVDVLPEIVWLGHGVGRRYQEAAKYGSIVSIAVGAAIDAGALQLAVEWLEAGRSLVWSQIISLRTPLDDLREENSQLADRLQEVTLQLQRSSHMSRLDNEHPSFGSSSLNSATASNAVEDAHHRLVIKFDNLLAEIRSHSGFERFLRSPNFASLIQSLGHGDGPVIFLGRGHGPSSSSYALVLFPSGAITPIMLHDLTHQSAQKLCALWVQYLEYNCGRMRAVVPPGSQRLRGGASIFGLVMARLWTWVIDPVLSTLNLTNNGDVSQDRLPHVTWCPTGPLTQLPLHAAGIYDTSQQDRPHVFDHIVSSYIPSLSALARCRKSSSTQTSEPNMLVVAQPGTPGLPPLPGTRRECARLRTILPQPSHVFLEHEEATIERVRTVLAQTPWVHLACHGSQNTVEPTESAFALYDGPLTLSTLMGTIVDNAELAFLSACQTAVGDEKVPEESVHLAAGMLAVGFKGVVGTMWSIGDNEAPVVVEAYYRKLLELRDNGTCEAGQTGAAYALHDAMRHLRELVGEADIVRWAPGPFVHFGA
ncbi:hypothetical protein PENSPDRAFT_585245 [Peniophora sp. CONT]|nr:hypothetical protein PENSPDRAFT_585245 [Peniophora sp. CONT]